MSSLDESVLSEVCLKIRNGYARRAESLGYKIAAVYSKNAEEMAGKESVYVLAEFYDLLQERKEDKKRLRALIPKMYECRNAEVNVILDYVSLPGKLKKEIIQISNNL